MKQVKARAKRPMNRKSELSSDLGTKLGNLAGPGSNAPGDLESVFYNRFNALRVQQVGLTSSSS